MPDAGKPPTSGGGVVTDLLRLQRTDPVAWALMPQTLARIMRFCREMETDSNPEEAGNLVCQWFAQGDPRLGLWVLVQDGMVVGHLWATPEPYETETWRYLVFRQAAVDRGISARAQGRAALEAACAWGRSLGLTRVVAVTHRNARALQRAWGFTPYKQILERGLDVPASSDPNSNGRGAPFPMPAPTRTD